MFRLTSALLPTTTSASTTTGKNQPQQTSIDQAANSLFNLHISRQEMNILFNVENTIGIHTAQRPTTK
ncbi:TPA: hypothetical protein ACYZ1O_004411 [Escherichia coli]